MSLWKVIKRIEKIKKKYGFTEKPIPCKYCWENFNIPLLSSFPLKLYINSSDAILNVISRKKINGTVYQESHMMTIEYCPKCGRRLKHLETEEQRTKGANYVKM